MRWFALTPDAHGSHRNGSWSEIASTTTPRLYYASAVMADGRVFVAGGECSPNSGEDTNSVDIYDPVANTWNYGERHRFGEAISNAFVESAVNQVVSKRMVRKQRMRWWHREAHLLLQIRARVPHEHLAGDFRRWYPAFMPTSGRQHVAA